MQRTTPSAASDGTPTVSSNSHSSRPVSIPEPKVLPYSRLSLRAHSVSSISPSPSQRILAAGSSPGGQDDATLTVGHHQQQSSSYSVLQALNPSIQQPVLYPRPRSGDAQQQQQQQQQPNKRPPLPPSPQARVAQGTLNPLSPAWINPGDGTGSGSGSAGRQPRILSAAAAAAGSYSEPSTLLSSAAGGGGSGGSPRLRHWQQQYASSLGSASPSPGGADGGLLAAAVSSEDVAVAAGNLYHPQHDAAMQLLMEHQQQQLQQLQQQRDHHQHYYHQQQQYAAGGGGGAGFGGGASSAGGSRAHHAYMRSSSFGSGGGGGGGAGGVGLSPRSPRVSPRAPSRSSSFNRLSELGTSPGLIEASFMGMAARQSSVTTSNANNASGSGGSSGSRSATLQQMMRQQQAAIRAQQQQQQRSLQHSRSTVSFEDWQGSSPSLSRAASSSAAAGGAGATAVDSLRASSSQAQLAARGARGTSSVASSSVLSESNPHHHHHQQQQQQRTLDWDEAQQQLLSQGGMASSLTVDGRGGMRALPGRVGLHWLSRADASESHARGLLGLPRPGLRVSSSGGGSRGWQQQQVPLPLQQQQQQQGDVSTRDSRREKDLSQEGEVCLQIPGAAAAAAAPTPPRVQYDPNVLASYAAAVDGGAASGLPAAAAALNSPRRGLFSSRSFGRQPSTTSSSSFSRQPDTVSNGRVNSSSSDAAMQLLRSGRSMSRSGSFASIMPTCLICLDQLTPADFESGEAMYLACSCKGEVALRHRHCAEKWSQIKGNTICDVCRQPILNLPDVPPLPAPPSPQRNVWGVADDDRLLYPQGSGLWGPLGDEPPAAADYVFDCIRVTWVVLIVCILFFELPVMNAFIMGALVGSGYVGLTATLASCRRWRRARRERQLEQEQEQEDDEDGAEHGGGGGHWGQQQGAGGLHAPLLLGGGGGGRGQLLPV